ncbi:MAG TPA: PD-(D/E)XK nuclease family protein [Thermoanaerobaculia bacterium]|nr:PD-(D/E)XK nuclease family protein [Thermoanaerobaculia bacterium]
MSVRPPLIHGSYPAITDALCSQIVSEISARPLAELLQDPVQILVPSRSAAETIAGGVAERLKRPVAGIVMRSIDTLAVEILNAAGEFPRSATDEEQRLAMIIAADAFLPSDLKTPGITAMLYRTYRDIRDSGLSMSMLAKKAPAPESIPGRVLPLFRELERLVSATGASDPADIHTRAALRISTGSTSGTGRTPCGPTRMKPQILFGFYDVTGVQERLLNALADAGALSRIYLPVPLTDGKVAAPYEFSSDFVGRLSTFCSELVSTWPDIPIPMSGRPKENPSPRTVLRKAEPDIGVSGHYSPGWAIQGSFDIQDELREACRHVRTLLDTGTAPREIAITARTLAGRELTMLQRAAREFDFELRNAPGRSLQSHRFGRTVRHLLEVREDRFPRAIVMEILRTGLSGGKARSDYEINAMDRAARECGIAGGGSAEVRGVIPHLDERARNRAPDLEAYAAAVEEIETLTAPVRSAATGETWATLLENWVARFVPASEEDLAAIDELLSEAALLRAVGGSHSLQLQTLIDLIAATPVLYPPERPGIHIWAGDVMKLRGRVVEHLVVLRMQDDIFPQRRVEDPLLRDRDRKRLGIRAVGDGRDEENLLFEFLLDSATKTIRFSYAMSDATGKTLRPSQLLSNFRRRPATAGRELTLPATALSLVERRVETAAANPTAPLLRKARLLENSGKRNVYDGYLTADGELQIFLRDLLSAISPTRLEPLGECPHRFLMGTVFSIRELEDPGAESESNPRVKGSLDHQILEEFYRELNINDIGASSAEVLESRLTARLRSIIARLFEAHALAAPAVNRNILEMERAAAEIRLERWVAWDLHELGESGFRPRHFELHFGDDQRERLEVGPVSLAIRGSIDRVDVHPETRHHRVIDYKSGIARAQQGLGDKVDRGHRLQLPLYTLVFEKLFELKPEQIDAIIRPLGDPRLDPGRYSFNLGEKRALVLENLTTLFEGILKGRFPAMPSEEACTYCVVGPWCRTRFDPDESRALRPWGSAVEMLRSLGQ